MSVILKTLTFKTNITRIILTRTWNNYIKCELKAITIYNYNFI